MPDLFSYVDGRLEAKRESSPVAGSRVGFNMACWFDVSDIVHWTNPQLTGIQRTVVYVLAHLRALRSDIKLFAFDAKSGNLREVSWARLPPAVNTHLSEGGGSLPHNEAIQIGNPSLRKQTKPHMRMRRDPNDPVRIAFRNLKHALTDLRIALRNRRQTRKGFQAALGEEEADETRVMPTCNDPLFGTGDVVLSMSATWGMRAYGDVIAANCRASKARCVNLIYDLIPVLHPEWVNPRYVRIIASWARQQIRNADLLLTISNFQKEEIGSYLERERLPSRPIEVIRLGDDPSVVHLAKRGVVSPPRYVPTRNFIICVSTVDPRKNPQCLYYVWRRLAEELGEDCPQLLLIGVSHPLVNDLMNQIRHDPLVNRHIVNLHDVLDEELAWYYSNCLFTVYPSMYEGWGLPISESLAIGKYCIAGDRTSLPEAGGDFADYFDPLDYMECFRKIRHAVQNPDYVAAREDRIRRDYRIFGWRDTAEQISSIVDRVEKGDGTQLVDELSAGSQRTVSLAARS